MGLRVRNAWVTRVHGFSSHPMLSLLSTWNASQSGSAPRSGYARKYSRNSPTETIRIHLTTGTLWSENGIHDPPLRPPSHSLRIQDRLSELPELRACPPPV